MQRAWNEYAAAMVQIPSTASAGSFGNLLLSGTVRLDLCLELRGWLSTWDHGIYFPGKSKHGTDLHKLLHPPAL
jgi:hypothetical protein